MSSNQGALFTCDRCRRQEFRDVPRGCNVTPPSGWQRCSVSIGNVRGANEARDEDNLCLACVAALREVWAPLLSDDHPAADAAVEQTRSIQ